MPLEERYIRICPQHKIELSWDRGEYPHCHKCTEPNTDWLVWDKLKNRLVFRASLEDGLDMEALKA
jgi:hypothetical protein